MNYSRVIVMDKFKRKLERLLWYIIPRIDNLPDVIYIRWLNRELFISKYKNW